MLDIHPAHHAATTWRDFFNHITTIVLGLLIAIGLEQLVEQVHLRYELRETREALARESEANRKDMEKNVRDWRREMAQLENNLLVLRYVRQHPGTPADKLPGELRWIQSPVLFEHAAWDAAQRNGMTRLMTTEEANRYNTIYSFAATLWEQSLHAWDAFNDASRYEVADGDPTHLTPQQLERVIDFCEITMEKHTQVGYTLAYLNLHFPELGSTINYDELRQYHHNPYQENKEAMQTAHQLTEDRLAPYVK